MRRLLPDPQDDVRAEDEYAVQDGRAWLRANMVSTVDGAVTDPRGLSGGISEPADRALFHVLRSLADAVVVGARTAHNERYRRAASPLVLLSRTLALDLAVPALAEPAGTDQGAVVIVGPESAPAARVRDLREHASTVGDLDVILVPGDDLDLRAALAALRGRGYHHLLCEGGPALLTSLVAEDLVDELCLTTSPLVAGDGAGRILRGSPLPRPQPWHLAGLCEDEGSLFARWQPARS